MRTHRAAFGWALAAAWVAGGCSASRSPSHAPPRFEGTVPIPAGRATLGSRDPHAAAPPGAAYFTGFRLGRCEVTRAQFAAFAQATGRARPGETPAAAEPRLPAADLTRGDAEAYCAWLSEAWGVRVRLPTAEEWAYAARGGVRGGRYPWGWGAPAGRACFDAAGPRPVGSYPANGYGLFDMAGNVFEWCAAAPAEADATACGGSWAERDPALLQVFRRCRFRTDYRGPDVGFRILVETPPVLPGERRSEFGDREPGSRASRP